MNTTFLKSAPLLLAASFALGGATATHAQAPVTINYSLGAFGLSAPNQDAYFKGLASPTTEALTLTPGVAQTINVQAIYLYVNPTSDNGDDYTGTLSRSLTVNGVTQSAKQNYDLTTNPGGYDPGGNTLFADDSLIFYPGNTSQTLSFDLGSQGVLTFTPEVLDGNGFQDEDADTNTDTGGTATYFENVKGKFLLTPVVPVPEASSLISTGLLLALGIGAFALRSRKRSATNA